MVSTISNLVSKMFTWILNHSYHIFGCTFSIGICLFCTQKLIEKCYKVRFKTSDHPDHLIIVQHGFWAPWIQSYPLGKYMAKIAKEKTKSDTNKGYLVQVITSNSNDYIFGFYSTCLGIEKGGKRIGEEIKQIIYQYPSINKISIIGSSLGGLYARQVVKQLYDEDKVCLRINDRFLTGKNFITLATPHLGVAGKIDKYLIKLAWIGYKLYLLPKTVTELLGFGKNPKLKEMATNRKYLKPLELFENKVIYANTTNDNRVSVSSGLILPSLEYKNEAEFMHDTYLEDIEYSRSNKKCIIRSFTKNMHCDNNLWYSNLRDDSMGWKRFVVSIDTSFMSKIFAHEFLSHPTPSFNDCQPVLDHISNQFLWE